MTTLIFGDSFIGPFSLIKDHNLKLYKFKGATMKGLGKYDNENRKKIIDTINKNKNINCIIFNFGQVDLYFSYYYDKFIKKQNFMMTSIIKKYVEFVNSLNCNNCNKIILAVYPSPITDENVFNVLLNYGILSNNVVNSISNSDKKKVSNFIFRYNMYLKFNNLLEKYCKLNKINFINLDGFLLDKNKKIKSKFIDPVSKFNIHLLWEPLIPIILSQLVSCKIKRKYKINLKNSYNNFIKEKKIRFNKRYK